MRAFLHSRRIELPVGSPRDPPGHDTVGALGNRKYELFLAELETGGVETYPGTVGCLRLLRSAAAKTACVSSSKNGRAILRRAGLDLLFDLIYDGNDLEQDGLPGKPSPAAFLRAAAILGVTPGRAAVVEDARPGVRAVRAGGFGLVIGVERGAGKAALRRAGADLVVGDLADLDWAKNDIRSAT